MFKPVVCAVYCTYTRTVLTPVLCVVYCAQTCTVQCILRTVYCALCTVCTVYYVHCVLFALCTVHVYCGRVLCTVYIVCSVLCLNLYILCVMHCPQTCSVHSDGADDCDASAHDDDGGDDDPPDHIRGPKRRAGGDGMAGHTQWRLGLGLSQGREEKGVVAAPWWGRPMSEEW